MRNVVLVFSSRDPAGVTMAQVLKMHYSFEETEEIFEGSLVYSQSGAKLVSSNSDIIEVSNLDEVFDPEAYIFLSRHKSDANIPAFTSHFPGNLGKENRFGGNPRQIAYTYPSIQKEFFKLMVNTRKEYSKYHVVLEPTHHGPTALKKAVLFVEIGSTEEEWRDENAAKHLCKNLIQTLESPASNDKVAIAFGGPHYSQKFSQLVAETEFALGAIAPKYILPEIDEVMIREMIEKSVEKITYAIVDWKGMGKEKERILELIRKTDLEIVRI